MAGLEAEGVLYARIKANRVLQDKDAQLLATYLSLAIWETMLRKYEEMLILAL